MPFASVVAPIVGSVAGGLVSGAMSPSVSGGGSSYYTPTGLGTADTTWQNIFSNLGNAFQGNNLGQYGFSSLNAGMGALGQYSPAYQSAANQTGTQYGNLSNTLNTQAGQNFNTQGSLLQAGQNVFNMGLDPQNALYDRTRQQVTDQSNAVNSMYGLGSSGAGAGMTNQALSNFNIDWQNNQLQRALQGLQGYAGAANTAGRYGELGTSQASSAPGYGFMAGQVPFQTAQDIAGVPGNLANTYGSFLNSNFYGPGEGIMSGAIPYMNYGKGAQAVPFQNQSNNAAAWGGTVGNGIQNAISNYFNPSSYSGDFSTSTPFSSTGFYDATTFGPSGYGGGYSYGGGNSYGFTM